MRISDWSSDVCSSDLQPDKQRVFFGATVTVADEDDRESAYTLVGVDEADAAAGRISWNTPIAKALRGAAVGDLRIVQLPGGAKELEIIAIRSEEHKSELQSLMRISYAVFCLKKKNKHLL